MNKFFILGALMFAACTAVQDLGSGLDAAISDVGTDAGHMTSDTRVDASDTRVDGVADAAVNRAERCATLCGSVTSRCESEDPALRPWSSRAVCLEDCNNYSQPAFEALDHCETQTTQCAAFKPCVCGRHFVNALGCPRTSFAASSPTRLTPPSSRASFGSSVAISADGTRIVVGDRGSNSPGPISDPGSVSVYSYNSSAASWSGPVLLSNTASAAVPGAGFGYDVAISANGSRIVVGAYGGDAISVYDFVSGAWNAGVELAPPVNADHFGKAVAISDNGLIVVAGDEDGGGGNGAVSIYTFDGTRWNLAHTLRPPSGIRDFGNCVAIAGNGARIVVGDQSGTPSRTVFDFISGAWSDATALPAATGTYDYIGCGFSQDGFHIVVDSDDYPAVVHSWTGSQWSAGVALLPEAARQNYSHSSAISADGSRVVVGDRGGDNGAGYRGAVTVFTREGATWSNASFSNPSVFENDSFGNDVAISADGQRVVVGSPTSELDGRGAVFVYDAR